MPFETEAGTLALLGTSVRVPVIAPAWLAEKVCGVPPVGVMVSVAERPLAVVFAAADHCTVAGPFPEPGEVTVSHGWLLLTVHPSSVSAVVNDTVPEPPGAGTFADDGLTVNTPPDCVTTNVGLGPREGFTVTVELRGVASGFGAAVYEKLPLPAPEPDEIVSHD